MNSGAGIGVLRRFVACGSVAALGLAALPAAAQGTGLTLDGNSLLGPRLQARVGINAGQSFDSNNPAWQQQAGVLLGDYYFSRGRLGSGDVSSGFRATSGLLLGQRSLALGTPALAGGQGFTLTMLRQSRWATAMGESLSEPWSTVPYLGVGWTGVSARGGWGLTADLGVAGRPANGGLRVGNATALDDLLRELRLTPVLHVGVSYAF
ncbi:MAG TPA: hypothetical protein VM845_02150 [Burkholderiaceae bacterium]|jgi:hypothetical protein|nr:hypothetical protein [Burkholderiaceae bacterium]